MKKYLSIFAAAILCLGLVPAYSQFGQMPRGPQFDGTMAKLFGENSAFSATSETKMKSQNGDMTMPGKITFDAGKTRFEMNVADAKGGQISPASAAQMKSMGMDQMVMIARPDKKISYLIYPGLQCYAELQLSNAEAAATNTNFKVDTTELGKETVDGHPCVKNKVIVTDDKARPHESTVWNATDLKNFPIKIFHVEDGNEITISFKNILLDKPAASQFEAPTDYKRYDNMQTMLQTEMMKRMGGGMGMPPIR